MGIRRIRATADQLYAWKDSDAVLGHVVIIDVTGRDGGNTEVALPMTHHTAKMLADAAGKVVAHLESELEATHRSVRYSVGVREE